MINPLYIKFAQIYLDGSACSTCNWCSRCAGHSGDTMTVKRCAVKLEQTIKEMQDELERNAKFKHNKK